MKEVKKVWIKFKDKKDYLLKEEKLQNLIRDYEGVTRVGICTQAEKVEKTLNRRIYLSDDLFDKLKKQFGEENIKCEYPEIESTAFTKNMTEVKRKLDLANKMFGLSYNETLMALVLLELEEIAINTSEI